MAIWLHLKLICLLSTIISKIKKYTYIGCRWIIRLRVHSFVQLASIQEPQIHKIFPAHNIIIIGAISAFLLLHFVQLLLVLAAQALPLHLEIMTADFTIKVNLRNAVPSGIPLHFISVFGKRRVPQGRFRLYRLNQLLDSFFRPINLYLAWLARIFRSFRHYFWLFSETQREPYQNQTEYQESMTNCQQICWMFSSHREHQNIKRSSEKYGNLSKNMLNFLTYGFWLPYLSTNMSENAIPCDSHTHTIAIWLPYECGAI